MVNEQKTGYIYVLPQAQRVPQRVEFWRTCIQPGRTVKTIWNRANRFAHPSPVYIIPLESKKQ